MYAKVTDCDVEIWTHHGACLARFTINFIPEPGNNCGSYEVYDESDIDGPPIFTGDNYGEIVGTICDDWLVQEHDD